MSRLPALAVASAVVVVALAARMSADDGDAAAQAENALVRKSCVGCHNEKGRSGGLSLQDFDAARIQAHPEVAEKMIRKLRAGMMPPPTVRSRPEPAALTAFAADLEARIDRAAGTRLASGSGRFQIGRAHV